jgi:murein DD-endopeptidase MepM/ murein hydrolase activator NlpD
MDWRACFSSPYGNRKDPFTGEKSKHSGIDLAADTGTPIYPVKSGVVVFTRSSDDGYGMYLVINHGGGHASLYGHCSEILVSAGDAVTSDTMIAKAGSTGRSTGPHCHLEIIIDGKPVNPKKYLEASIP